VGIEIGVRSSRPLLPLPAAERLRRGLRVFTALHEMSLGRARSEEWRDLADVLNIVKALCALGKLDAHRYSPQLKCVMDGMIEASHCANGQIRMGAAELVALREMVTVYDDAIGRFAAQTISVATARVMLTIANARDAKHLVVEPSPAVLA
jgi:hypothetical protein